LYCAFFRLKNISPALQDGMLGFVSWLTKGIKMSSTTQIFSAILLLGFVIYLGFQLKKNPQLLDKSSLSRSATTVGVLGLILIAFVGFLILMLKGGR